MPRISFTANVQRHLDCPDVAVDGATVAEALVAAFARNPKARSYFLDDQGAVRTHIVIFVDGVPLRDRTKLSDPVEANGEIYVMQALSGG